MTNYTKYKNLILKGVYSLWLLSIMANGEPTTLEEIKQATNGKGVFSIVITNTGKKESENVNVFMHMTNPPSGCEYLKFSHARGKYFVHVKPDTTVIVELPVPFLSSQKWDGTKPCDNTDLTRELPSPYSQKWDEVEQYDNTDNLLPIPDNSEVIVEIRNIDHVKEHGINSLMFLNTSFKLRSRGFNQVFKAKYLAGTRLVELPDQIQISINYDEMVRGYNPGKELMEMLFPLDKK